MFDIWDIVLFKRFLKLARTKGTDAIKVIAGDKPNVWIVTILKEGKGNGNGKRMGPNRNG